MQIFRNILAIKHSVTYSFIIYLLFAKFSFKIVMIYNLGQCSLKWEFSKLLSFLVIILHPHLPGLPPFPLPLWLAFSLGREIPECQEYPNLQSNKGLSISLCLPPLPPFPPAPLCQQFPGFIPQTTC